MSRPSRIIVLAEDQEHQRFVRYYWKRRGYEAHDFHFLALPNGRGCGEQWVRDRYVQQVAALRARRGANKGETALVVAIDGKPDLRATQFREALRSANAIALSENEQIVHLVCNRSVETWVKCISEQKPVDETVDFSRMSLSDRIKVAAESLWMMTRPHAAIPDYVCPSLRLAIEELRKWERNSGL